ncbi:MAG: 1,4-dihydroxy-2-naphthoate polyprenyltransferase [Acidimicrobiia bacterium]
MTTVGEWVQGSRPRTLGAAVAPVLVGTAAAVADADGVIWWRFASAMVVALALQVGVNYANDYSDGVRGTDRDRKGPLRLTASGVATPKAVRNAAALAFAVAAVVGLVLSLVVNPWLLLVGVAAIAAAVLYTGGPVPLGYLGVGELMVLVFFGFVATVGSAYVQVEYVPGAAWWGSLVVGLLACAILLANNVRDVPTDTASGKRTLAVRVGAPTARALFVACYAGSFAAVVAIGITQPWALLGLGALPLAIKPVRIMRRSTDPPSLVAALVATSRLEVVVAVLVSVGLCLS